MIRITAKRMAAWCLTTRFKMIVVSHVLAGIVFALKRWITWREVVPRGHGVLRGDDGGRRYGRGSCWVSGGGSLKRAVHNPRTQRARQPDMPGS
jgi:hypothetical protein